MQKIHFITGNPGKLREASHILKAAQIEVISWPLDLPEIQHSDARKVIEAKLLTALSVAGKETHFFVEDTSLYLDALQGLPGPLIKWFIAEDKLGLNGLAELTQKMGNTAAKARTCIGYLHRQTDQIQLRFFEGQVTGQIVSPRGNKGFGWDPIFQPDGSGQTFGEMAAETKTKYSMRRLALEAFQEFLAGKTDFNPK